MTAKKRILIGVLLAAAVAAVYWPVVRAEFIHCDDPDYVLTNPQVQAGLSWEGVTWAFTTDHANNWHPLTWLSHMLDCQIFGIRPGWHHLTNAVLHLINTLLLFSLLRRLTGATWRSAFVAALFGLHPLHVESVAWIAERKDVLSALFFMLTLSAYATYASRRTNFANTFGNPENQTRQDQVRETNNWQIHYCLALVLFLLGLMCKPMLVTLPFLLILLDYWPLQRFSLPPSAPTASTPQPSSLRSLFLEKLPFFALSAASCVITVLVQRHEGNVASVSALPVELRVENALVAYAIYIKKMFWPTRLAAYYPYSRDIPMEAIASAAAVMVVISASAIALIKRRPYFAVGWLWFVGMLVPVIGLVQVGLQAMADRYTYLPLIGLFMAIAWGLHDLSERWGFRKVVSGVAAIAVLAGCMILTSMQIRLWKNTETLFGYALKVTTRNAHAHLNLGSALAQRGKLEEAAEHFVEAVNIKPDYPEAQSNLGFTLAAQGKIQEAIDHYRAALAVKPRLAQTHFLLGNALSAQGKRKEARAEYETALQILPTHPLALNDLAWMLATDPDEQQRNGAEAVRLAQEACRVTQNGEAQFIGTLAAAYAEAGQFEKAVQNAEKAGALAAATGQIEIAEKNRQLLELYRDGKPYRETSNPGAGGP